MMMLNPETIERMQECERRLKERGIVDVKFFKNYLIYSSISPNNQMNDICDVIEAMLDGKYTPAEPLGDSVR